MDGNAFFKGPTRASTGQISILNNSRLRHSPTFSSKKILLYFCALSKNRTFDWRTRYTRFHEKLGKSRNSPTAGQKSIIRYPRKSAIDRGLLETQLFLLQSPPLKN